MAATDETMERYRVGLDRELDAAARVRWDDAEAFLWRARRVTEVLALTLWLHTREKPWSPLPPKLDELIGQLSKDLPRTVLDDLLGLQRGGNAGAHFQPEGVDAQHYAGISAQHLVNLVRWVDRAVFRRGPEVLQRVLLAIESREHRVKTDTERLRTEVEEWKTAATIGEDSIKTLQDDLRTNGTALVEAQAALKSLVAERETLSGRVSALSSVPRTRVTARQMLLIGLFGVGIGGLMAGGAVLGVRTYQRSVRQAQRAAMRAPVVPPTTPVRVAPEPVVTPPPVVVVAADVPVVRDVATRVVRPCPAGTVTIEAATIDLLPIRRGVTDVRTWAASRATGLQRFEVTRACIDVRWVDARFRTHDEAVAACAAKGAGWRLPSALEWEALSRQRNAQTLEPQTGPSTLTNMEWVSDAYPAPFVQPTVEARATVTGVRHHARGPSPFETISDVPVQSWNLPPSGTALHVRCALTADEP